MPKELKLRELIDVCINHNKEKGVERQYGDEKPLICRIVFSNDSYSKEYDILERTYEFRSDNKYFIPRMLGNSIFADCLDGKDNGVRLDWYMFDWVVEYCYIVNEEDI